MIQVVIEGILLGLSTGAYCVGTCMVFFMPYLLAEGQQKIGENLKRILFFMLGRLIAYIAFAATVGFLGERYTGVMTVRFSYICLIAISLVMISYAVTRGFGQSRFCRRMAGYFGERQMPLALGVLSGLNPCMPFLTGAARIWTLGSVMKSVVLFLAFFLGTAVYMMPLVFVSYLNRAERFKQIGLIMAFLAGIWFLFTGITGLIK